jgi:hypothetical protein
MFKVTSPAEVAATYQGDLGKLIAAMQTDYPAGFTLVLGADPLVNQVGQTALYDLKSKVELASNQHIQGVGAHKVGSTATLGTIISIADPLNLPIAFSCSRWSSLRELSVSVGAAKDQLRPAVLLSDCEHVIIDRIAIREFSRAATDALQQHQSIADLETSNTAWLAGVSIQGNSMYNVVRDCLFKNCDAGVALGIESSSLGGTSQKGVNHNRVEGCRFDGGSVSPVVVYGGTSNIIRDCSFDTEFAFAAVEFLGANQNCVVQNRIEVKPGTNWTKDETYHLSFDDASEGNSVIGNALATNPHGTGALYIRNPHGCATHQRRVLLDASAFWGFHDMRTICFGRLLSAGNIAGARLAIPLDWDRSSDLILRLWVLPGAQTPTSSTLTFNFAVGAVSKAPSYQTGATFAVACPDPNRHFAEFAIAHSSIEAGVAWVEFILGLAGDPLWLSAIEVVYWAVDSRLDTDW